MAELSLKSLFIAEYETMPTWTSSRSPKQVSIKEREKIIIYQLGRHPSFMTMSENTVQQIIKNLGAELVDATQMCDKDVQELMLNQIKEYASEGTHIYFLGCTDEYQALLSREKTCAGFSMAPNIFIGKRPDDLVPPKQTTLSEQEGGKPPTKELSSARTDKTQTANQNKKPSHSISEEAQPNKAKPDAYYRHPAGQGQQRKKNKKQEKASKSKANIQPVISESHNSRPQHSKTTKEDAKKTKPIEENDLPVGEGANFLETMAMAVNDASQPVVQSEAGSKQKKNNNSSQKTNKQDNHSETLSHNPSEAEKPVADRTSTSQPEKSESPKEQLKETTSDRLTSSVKHQSDERVIKKEDTASANDPTVVETTTTESQNKGKPNNEHINSNQAKEDDLPLWAEEIERKVTQAKNTPPLTEAQKEDQKRQEAERSIFSSQPQPKKVERYVSPTEEAKTVLVNLLIERTIGSIKVLAPQTKDFSFDEYTLLISTLVRSEGIDDFNQCWSVVRPGSALKLDEPTYIALRQEALYFATTCDQLYVKDRWKK